METSAKVVADSFYPGGVRLTTMEVTFHRFVLAEFNTHRLFSRNSASSRAIPALRQTSMVQTDPAIPLSFPAEQKGMQGGQKLSDAALSEAEQVWRVSSRVAVEHAAKLISLGVHKSVTNRLLEPFLMHTVVVTSTAWENFFEQRCSRLAQPEIRAAAELMQSAYLESRPETFDVVDVEAWHLPYIQPEDCRGAFFHESSDVTYWSTLARVSAARCARVSYLTQDGTRDFAADLTLYDRLVSARPAHWSPLEHVATPWAWNRQAWAMEFESVFGTDVDVVSGPHPKVGNLPGWRSLRTEVEAMQDERTYR